MEIKVFVKGPIDANNYLLIDENTKDAILIDCSDDFTQEVEKLGVNLKFILLTHGHYDHILGVDEFCRKFNIKAYISQDDLFQVNAAGEMMQMFSGIPPVKIETNFEFIKNDEELFFGNTKITAISTPGHTQGGMCYLIEDKLFSGDTVFRGTVGRSDLPGGNWRDLLSSVRDKIFLLPDNVQVLPGHGDMTTIEYERRYNEILNI